MQNVWYLNVSYKAEVVTLFVFRTRTNLWYLKLFALCRICDIFLLRTRREVVLFGFLPNKEDYVCIKREESPLILFVYSNQKVNFFIIILNIHQQYLYTLYISKSNILSKS